MNGLTSYEYDALVTAPCDEDKVKLFESAMDKILDQTQPIDVIRDIGDLLNSSISEASKTEISNYIDRQSDKPSLKSLVRDYDSVVKVEDYYLNESTRKRMLDPQTFIYEETLSKSIRKNFFESVCSYRGKSTLKKTCDRMIELKECYVSDFNVFIFLLEFYPNCIEIVNPLFFDKEKYETVCRLFNSIWTQEEMKEMLYNYFHECQPIGENNRLLTAEINLFSTILNSTPFEEIQCYIADYEKWVILRYPAGHEMDLSIFNDPSVDLLNPMTPNIIVIERIKVYLSKNSYDIYAILSAAKYVKSQISSNERIIELFKYLFDNSKFLNSMVQNHLYSKRIPDYDDMLSVLLSLDIKSCEKIVHDFNFFDRFITDVLRVAFTGSLGVSFTFGDVKSGELYNQNDFYKTATETFTKLSYVVTIKSQRIIDTFLSSNFESQVQSDEQFYNFLITVFSFIDPIMLKSSFQYYMSTKNHVFRDPSSHLVLGKESIRIRCLMMILNRKGYDEKPDIDIYQEYLSCLYN